MKRNGRQTYMRIASGSAWRKTRLDRPDAGEWAGMLGFENRLELELDYIDHYSIWLDL